MADSFVFYRSYYEALEDMPMEVQVHVWRAIFEHELNGVVPELEGAEAMAWKLIKPQLDACRKRRDIAIENGKKGGRPPKKVEKPTGYYKETENNPVVYNEKPNNNLNVNVNVNDNVNDNVNVNPNVNVNENANENVNVNGGPPWYTDRHGAYFDRDGRTLLTDMRAEGFRRQGAEDSLFEYCIAKMGEQEGVKNPAKYLETMIREHVDYGRMTWIDAERHDRERKKNKGKSEDKKEDYPIYDPPDWG